MASVDLKARDVSVTLELSLKEAQALYAVLICDNATLLRAIKDSDGSGDLTLRDLEPIGGIWDALEEEVLVSLAGFALFQGHRP